MKLNIGCGKVKLDGFVNIDKAKEVNPDKVVDIEKGLPFKDSKFTHIFSEHCLEHIRPEKWAFVLNEIQRVARDGCILELYLPFDNVGQRTNADHYRTFSWHSFDQFLDGSEREYYSDLNLWSLIGYPNKIVKLFFYLFPFLKYEVYFRFMILKKSEVKKWKRSRIGVCGRCGKDILIGENYEISDNNVYCITKKNCKKKKIIIEKEFSKEAIKEASKSWYEQRSF